MQDDYLEHTTPSGLVLRVNLRHGTFLVFRDGAPVSVARGGAVSQIHPLTHVYFLGASFELQSESYDSINFFKVERGFLMIPFTMEQVSDVRHIRIPVPFEADMLPALAVQFRSYWPGPLPAVGEGRRFFIAEPAIDRQSIIRIKGRYPRARLMIYRPDEPAAIRIEQEHDGAKAYNKRAVDLVEKSEAKLFAQNPVFAARVYLRELDWKRMHSLPLYGKLTDDEVNSIVGFLTGMKGKADSIAQLKEQLSSINETLDMFEGLQLVFKLEMPPVKKYYESHFEGRRQILQTVISWVEAQRRFYEKEDIRKVADFFRDATFILSNQEISRVEFISDD